MSFQPPTSTSANDVTVKINNESSSQGSDHNGIITGRWKTGIFGFTDTIVPNAVMSCCCPAVSVAQIAARVGMMPFNHVLGAFGGLYFVAFLAAVTSSKLFDVLFWLAAITAALCLFRMRMRLRTVFSLPGSPLEDAFFSFCCGCCSIAQMASHVESYEPGTIAFAPRETLQGYAFN